MKISGAVIAKNEERCIRRCIESFIDITDEFILVDTGSTDATAAIAEECGARVEHFAWTGSFADARNYALSRLTGDWVVMLDADEWFPEGHAKALWEVIMNCHGNRTLQGIMTFMHDMDDDPEEPGNTEKYIMRKCYRTMRAMRKLKGLKYTKSIHERAMVDGQPLRVYYLPDEDVCIQHDGYRQSLQKAKAQRNLAMNLQYWKETQEAEYLQYIAIDYYRLGENEKALEYFEKYRETGAFLDFFGLYPYYIAAEAMKRLDATAEKFAELADDAYHRYKDMPSAVFLKAEAMYEQQRFSESYELYRQCIAMLGDNPYAHSDFGLTVEQSGRVKAMRRMAEIDKLRGDKRAALEWLAKALRIDGKDEKVFGDMARLMRDWDAKKAISFWEKHVDTSDTAQLEMLLAAYGKVKLGIEYLVFFEKWFMKTGRQGIFFVTMLIIIGEYRDAFDRLLLIQRETAWAPPVDMAAAVAWLSGNLAWLREDFPDSAQHLEISERIQNGEALGEDDWGLYTFLLNKLALLMPRNDVRLKAFACPALLAPDEDKLVFLDILHQSDQTEVLEPLLETVKCSPSPKIRAQGYRVSMMMRFDEANYIKAADMAALGLECDPGNQIFKEYRMWIDQKR